MVELVGNIPDDVVLQARLDILYGQTPDITIKAHELPEESEPTVEKSGTLAEPVFDIGIPQAMGAVAAREYAKQAEAARDAAILAGENAKEELNGIVASADAALDQKITETGTALDEKVATATQRASEAASSAAAAAQKATAAEQAMQGAQAAQVQAEQSAQKAAENTAMAKDFASGQPVTYSGTPVSIAYAGANRIDALTLYGENAQGGTTEAPVALTGVDSVFVGGRNLLPMVTETKTLNGVTFTPNPNGSVSVSGTATNIATYVFANGLDDSLLGQTLCLSGDSMQTQLIINEMKPTGEWIRHVFIRESTPSSAGILSKQAEANILYATIYVPAGTTVNTTVYPMLNLSESPLPYEPYQGSVTTLPIPRPLHKVGDVRDVCRTRVKSVYDKRIVLDGTEIWTEYTDENWQGAGYHVYRFYDADALLGQPIVSNKYPSRRGSSSFKGTLGVASGGQSILFSVVEQKTVDDWKAYLADQKKAGTPLIIYRQSTAYDGTNGLDVCLTEYQTGYIESYADESITTAWISSTGALSTGAEVAYVLSSPETYATDPLDIDNAAGPLTVMTGGELEVRMTDLVGSRSPELAGKMDKATYDADGDGVVDEAAAAPWSGITGKPDTFPPSAHNHDDRYYTETETDTKLAGKANSSHTHSKDQVGLGNVDNTADANKTVLEANRLKVRTTSSLVVTGGSGLYYYPANAQDLPPNNQDGLLLFITYGAWGGQLAFPTGGGVYYRYGTTTFSAWKRLDS